MSCMNYEQFCEITSQYKEVWETTKPKKDYISVDDIPNNTLNRTLIRGEFFDGRDFHLFIKDDQLYRVVTHRFGMQSTIQSGDSVLSEPVGVSTVFSVNSIFPDLVYGDSTDYEFTLYLLEQGILLPIDYWDNEGFLRRRMFSVLGHGDPSRPEAAYRGRFEDFDKCGYYHSATQVDRVNRPKNI